MDEETKKLIKELPLIERALTTGYIKEVRKQAKYISQNSNLSHKQALDLVAQKNGFTDWRDLKKTPKENSRKIVIVDDIPQAQENIKNILTAEGYKVVATFQYGEEAVIECEKIKPYLVILDINLPGENALEICSLLKRIRPTPPKVILITAFLLLVNQEKAKKVGADRVIVKDTGYTFLKETVKRLYATV